MNYEFSKEVSLSFDEAVAKVREELQKEGFGVLTDINVKETLEKKLNVESDNYVILGACNPQFAYKALQTEKEIGLVMPCNVIVYSNNGKTIVSAINPTQAVSMFQNEELKRIAKKGEEKLKKVVEAVR